MLDKLLPTDIVCILIDNKILNRITELRLRIGKIISYSLGDGYYNLYSDNEGIICTKSMIDYVLSVATGRSLYAYNEQIANGFIATDSGIRIGITGQGVNEQGKILTYKYISYMVIRVPHEIKGVAKCIVNKNSNYDSNILIISPPGAGKTTLLRDYVRMASNSGKNVLLLDERNEVSATCNGCPTLDIGRNTDVVSLTDKLLAYKAVVRAMAPDIIATDEIFGMNEVNLIRDVVRCGINVVATMHGDNIEDLYRSEYSGLMTVFDYAVVIDKKSHVGNIREIRRIRE